MKGNVSLAFIGHLKHAYVAFRNIYNRDCGSLCPTSECTAIATSLIQQSHEVCGLQLSRGLHKIGDKMVYV